jgi:rSAM/selenodomain-associated transferase 2
VIRAPVLISIIIPTLNEETAIGSTMEAIAKLRGVFEVIVVDGGSTDRTIDIVAARAKVLHAPRGRGIQQAAGANAANGEVFWFLHADSVPSPSSLTAIESSLGDQRVAGGNFSLRFDGQVRSARQLTAIYPYLRFMRLCYGDSGIFVRRAVYNEIGGFRSYSLFEDLDLVKRIRTRGKFRTLSEELVTSSRRFEHRNFAAMFAEWTALQLLLWVGVPPDRLARLYAPVRRRSMY